MENFTAQNYNVYYYFNPFLIVLYGKLKALLNAKKEQKSTLICEQTFSLKTMLFNTQPRNFRIIFNFQIKLWQQFKHFLPQRNNKGTAPKKSFGK